MIYQAVIALLRLNDRLFYNMNILTIIKIKVI